MVAEAGNEVSAAVFRSLGFQEAASVPYSTFSFEGHKPFASLTNDGFNALVMFNRSIASNLYV